MLVQAIKSQGEVLGYCIDFLHQYSCFRLHMIARGCKVFEREEEDVKKFSYTIRSASCDAWQQTIDMMEELEKTRIEGKKIHMLLSESR